MLVINSQKLSWYISRLKTMGLPETTHRVGQLLQKRYEKWHKSGYFPPAQSIKLPDPILFFPKSAGPFPTDTYHIFGHPLDITQAPDWHADIISGTRFPQDFSFSIDTRTGRYGIAKVVWEVNRLQFLTGICLAYRYTGDRRYLRQFIDLVESWQKANPYLQGVNWYASIEVSLRVITWFLCWEILDATALYKRDQAFREFVDILWLPLIYLHGSHIYRHPSRYSSSNNHSIAEACGLFIAGTYWRFTGSEKWVRNAQQVLTREIKLQHSAGGVNKEEASEYIQFITDFLLISQIVGVRTNCPLPTDYNRLLRQIFIYIRQLTDCSGQVPYYGDDDDGHAYWIPPVGGGNNFQSLLVSGATIFREPVLKTPSATFDLKNTILFGSGGEQTFDTLQPRNDGEETVLFQDAGHIIIKKTAGTREIYLHVDAAPLGYLSIAAHGHADALSFFLRLDGIPFFADVGTYTYHSEPPWRAYFKGTLAHNTIRVDGQDQAYNAGPCLWLDHYESHLIQAEETKQTVVIEAEHNGYRNLGIHHKRTYQLDKSSNILTIRDRLTSDDNQSHTYEIPFHLHPQIQVSEDAPGRYVLSSPHTDCRVRISLDAQLAPQQIRGQTEPILGWYSPSFLQKEPTTVIYALLNRTGSFELETLIEFIV